LIASTVADWENPHGPVSGSARVPPRVDRVDDADGEGVPRHGAREVGGAVVANDVRDGKWLIGLGQNTVREILRRAQTGRQKMQGDRRIGATQHCPSVDLARKRVALDPPWPAPIPDCRARR
jgi:hypothetical protein